MKVFISQRMNGLTDSEILRKREETIEIIKERHPGCEILDSYISEDAPTNVNPGIWYLGKSLEILAQANLIFVADPAETNGMVIELMTAQRYGIQIEDKDGYWPRGDIYYGNY